MSDCLGEPQTLRLQIHSAKNNLPGLNNISLDASPAIRVESAYV